MVAATVVARLRSVVSASLFSCTARMRLNATVSTTSHPVITPRPSRDTFPRSVRRAFITGFSTSDEAIAQPPRRLDGQFCADLGELAAQLADVLVKGVVGHDRAQWPCRADQLTATDHRTGGAEQLRHQPKLG